jgi:FkbM family methyltransferase
VTGPFVISNDGIAFAGDLGSYIDRQTYLFGQYEEASIELFLSRVLSHRKGVILDVGANAGTHSLAFARHFEQVHSFEPNPQLWAQFHCNVSLNGFENIVLHKVGLGERNAELPFHMIEKRNYGLGTFSTVEQYDQPLKRVGICTVVNGDDYLRAHNVGAIDAMKVDVQGFEPLVLRGLAATLRRSRPLVWFEYGPATKTAMRTADDLREFFPYQVEVMHMTKTSGPLALSEVLQPVLAELPLGDYIIIPS